MATTENVFAALYARYCAYRASTISEEIAECDEMLVRGAEGALEHYMGSGRSAIDVILAAMLTAGKDACPTVLDLPCGAGRVTRHLRPFFPESDLFVSDLLKDHEQFVIEHIRGAQPFSAPLNFRGTPERAFAWFIKALAPDGLLILTTHGRCQEYLERVRHHHVSPDLWEEACRSRDSTGFGFASYGTDRPMYGLSLMVPSWIIRLVEQEPTTRIISFGETLWNRHHDVLVLQKRSALSPWVA